MSAEPFARGAEDVVLELANDLASIEKAVDYVMQCCAGLCRDQRRLMFDFRLGLTEAISNAMLYGNGSDPTKKVRVEVKQQVGEIRAQVTDEGRGFDPKRVEDPTTPQAITKTCGRGIFLMRHYSDELVFNARGNSVTLVFRDHRGPETVDPR